MVKISIILFPNSICFCSSSILLIIYSAAHIVLKENSFDESSQIKLNYESKF